MRMMRKLTVWIAPVTVVIVVDVAAVDVVVDWGDAADDVVMNSIERWLVRLDVFSLDETLY